MRRRSSEFIIGSQATRATLTNAYTGNRSAAIKLGATDKFVLDIEYTMGATETANSVEVLVEFGTPISNPPSASPESTEWYIKTSEVITAGVPVLTANGYQFVAASAAATYDRFQTPEIAASGEFVRVSIKETGVAANAGSASVKLIKIEDVK